MKTKGRNFEKDFLDFIELCKKHKVKYLVIGGFAVSVHGYPRYTKDLDICIELSEENAERMVKVIDEFGLSSLKLTKNDFLKPNFFTQIGFEPVRIDILNGLDEVPFSEAWQNRKTVKFEGTEIDFIGYNELLKIKTAAGRLQDLADIEKLKKRNKGKK